LKSAISDEDYDEFTAVMDKQRQQLLFRPPIIAIFSTVSKKRVLRLGAALDR